MCIQVMFGPNFERDIVQTDRLPSAFLSLSRQFPRYNFHQNMTAYFHIISNSLLITLLPFDGTDIPAAWRNVSQKSTQPFKGKAVPLQAWTSPDGSRRLRSQISRQSAHEGGNVASPKHRPPLVLISVRGLVNPRATVRPEGLCQ